MDMHIPLGGKELSLAVFVSGSGTNLQALIDRAESGQLRAKIEVVVSDRADAYGIERAKRHGIPAFVVDYADYINRCATRAEAYRAAEMEILEILERFEVDYVCLAGFMRLVSPSFLQCFRDGLVYRVLNIHPALLPSFPGMHGYEDTFSYGCKWGGVTVHFVDEGEDTGPIIAQAVYPIWPDDTIEVVRQRGLSLEYELYAQVVNWIASGFVRAIKKGRRTICHVTDPKYSLIIRNLVEKAMNACSVH